MSIRRTEIQEVVIIRPIGSFFGGQETDDFEEALMREAANGNTRLLLNLLECVTLNSVAIGALMRAYANYKARGGQIVLCHLGKRLYELLTMTRLIQVFDHYETEEQALAAISGGSSIVG